MGTSRGREARLAYVNFHFPCRIACGGANRGDETRVHENKLPLNDIACWTRAVLLSPSSIKIIAGDATTTTTTTAVLVSCSDIGPLYTITKAHANDKHKSANYLSSLAVRLSRCSTRPPVSPLNRSRNPGCGATTAADAITSVSVDLWAELLVLVRPNTRIYAHPSLRSAWQLMLPHLVLCNREDAPSIASAGPAAALECTGAATTTTATQSSTATNSEAVLQVRALEAVYASLKADTRRDSLLGGDSSSVGPGPGASGLNALPAAVVMKGE